MSYRELYDDWGPWWGRGYGRGWFGHGFRGVGRGGIPWGGGYGRCWGGGPGGSWYRGGWGRHYPGWQEPWRRDWSEEDEREALARYARDLKEELDEVNRRIERLGRGESGGTSGQV